MLQLRKEKSQLRVFATSPISVGNALIAVSNHTKTCQLRRNSITWQRRIDDAAIAGDGFAHNIIASARREEDRKPSHIRRRSDPWKRDILAHRFCMVAGILVHVRLECARRNARNQDIVFDELSGQAAR